MDPQKLFFLDRKVVRTDRIISFFFSLAIGFLLFLINRGVVYVPDYSEIALYVGAAGFVALGTVQLIWNPYTKLKVLVYDVLYACLGALVSVFVLGFNSGLVFLAWLMLIISVAIYFDRKLTGLVYLVFFLSMASWIITHSDQLNNSDVVELLFAAIFVGWITLFILTVWQLFNRSVRQLDTSRESEKLVRERLSSLINSMADGVLAVDEKCKIVEYNGALLNILDLNITLRGKNINQIGKFIDENNQPIDIKSLVMGVQTQLISRDLKIVYKDKSTANLYISIASVHLGFGHEYTKGFVLVMRDITREKSLEEERDEFISVVSHELRTPIAIAEGNVSNAEFVMEKSKVDAPTMQAMKQAHQQILFLSDMINDLATLSRAERGKESGEVEDIDVIELVKELGATYTPQAAEKNLKFIAESDDSIKKLHSNRLYVKEVLQNFITNAIKYTEKGSVTLKAHSREHGILFEVIDTGIGISKSDQEKVFDKFFRSEDYRTREHSGTGLGLYVTMKLAKLIHSDIDLESEINKGSTFSIFIPNIEKDKKS
jgi:two-component system, OmpR family, phosphate regulon sensor histidine kinase PhoR